MTKWSEMAHAIDALEDVVTIALVGKYTGLQDSYLSVIKALKHAACEVQPPYLRAGEKAKGVGAGLDLLSGDCTRPVTLHPGPVDRNCHVVHVCAKKPLPQRSSRRLALCAPAIA